MDNQGIEKSNILSQAEEKTEKKTAGDKPLLKKNELNIIVSLVLSLILNYLFLLFILVLGWVALMPFEDSDIEINSYFVFGIIIAIEIVFNIFLSKFLSRKYEKNKQAFWIIFWTPLMLATIILWLAGVFSNI